MRRTLSITLDDEEKTIAVENQSLFSTIELLGIAEYLRLGTEAGILRKADTAEQADDEKGVKG